MAALWHCAHVSLREVSVAVFATQILKSDYFHSHTLGSEAVVMREPAAMMVPPQLTQTLHHNPGGV